MLSRFHLIPGRHGQTENRTVEFISRVSVLTRDKNGREIVQRNCPEKYVSGNMFGGNARILLCTCT